MIEGHGDDSYKYVHSLVADFSSNVSNHANLSGLQAHLSRCIGSIAHYPEPEPYTLEARIADKYHLPKASVCVTNGATEAIYLIAQTFRGTNSAILQPTFSEYADACCIHAHQIASLHQFPTEGLAENIRMCWLCNPNNPTGTVVEKSLLTELINRHPQVCFVIDQSYEAFTQEPLFTPAQAAEYPHVLLLHSMTKQHSIPGLRLGYITGDTGLLNRLRAHRMPWSVNQVAIEAGLYLLNHAEEMDLTAYLGETARLRNALNGLGALEVWDTQTHYMLAQLRFGKASALKEYLACQHGLLIRDASNFNGLNERFFRIATQTPQENDLLIQAIEKWIADY